jgi:propanol-preferring alcohol dehydrogenase
MKAMVLNAIVSLDQVSEPLTMTELPVPVAGPGELLLAVSACGVCHTELDEIEGRTAPPVLPIIPGHEVIGRVAALGPGCCEHELGDRVGVGWIHSSTGGVDENVSDQFVATGRDVNGGYAEYMTVPEAYAVPIPERLEDIQAAPLLCAGAIGYRALKLCNLRDGDRLGLTGFGGSAHLVLQTVRHLLPRCEIFVFARDAASREFARSLGADWVGATEATSPKQLDAIIDTTPAWRPIVCALNNLRPGGRLVINAIRKEDADKTALLELSYHQHLWLEREIKTVANITAADIREFLPIAADIPIETTVTVYPLEQANDALLSLKHQPVRGAKVLVTSNYS